MVYVYIVEIKGGQCVKFGKPCIHNNSKKCNGCRVYTGHMGKPILFKS